MAKADAIDTRHYDVIVAPHITEKATMASEQNAVVFRVAGDVAFISHCRNSSHGFCWSCCGTCTALFADPDQDGKTHETF